MQDFTKMNRPQAKATTAGFQPKTVSIDQGLRAHMVKVYNYMAAALGVTGLVAYFAASSDPFMAAMLGSPLKFAIMFGPFAFILVLSFGINRMSLFTAQAVFWAFSVVMGLSLSAIFLVYTGESIARTFFITASLFGAMSLYGYTTKRDLTSMGSFLMMGLLGIILASLVNIFLKSAGIQFAISILAVIIFTGLTAYDTQRIKNMYFEIVGHGETLGKAALMGALALYLDFINLFIQLLRFFGDRR